jgi:hypothetical protein
MRLFILIAIAVCVIGCSEESAITNEDSTVHLAGFVGVPDTSIVASYWKDTVYTALANDATSSRVGSLSVDGSTVLIGGSKFFSASPSQTLVWRNGTEDILDGVFGNPMIASSNDKLFGVWLDTTGWVFHKNGISHAMVDTAYDFAPMAMTVFNDDVYISGFSSGPSSSPMASTPQHAQYWKNSQLIFRENEDSNGLSIFIHQGNVYMAGVVYPLGGLTSVACYWKNGQRVDLTDGGGISIARSVFVTDDHVYVAGMMDGQAVYWKDGEVTALTATGTSSIANSIFVKGVDVHVGGCQNGHPAYWKNDIRQYISNQERLGQILFVVVGSN